MTEKILTAEERQEMQVDQSAARLIAHANRPSTAYGGCTCSCHRGDGKIHFVACCSIKDEKIYGCF